MIKNDYKGPGDGEETEVETDAGEVPTATEPGDDDGGEGGE